MASDLERRLTKLEGDTRGRPQVLWVEEGMTPADIDAEVSRRLAAGTMDVMDELHLIGWKTGDDRTHEE
jgi:hypothetical protein